MRSVTRLSTILLALTTGAAAARAGGFTTTRFGGEDGHAATSDPTAVFYNPAGIAYSEGTHIYAEGLFAYRTVDYNRDAGAIDNAGTGTPTDAVNRNSGKATLANTDRQPVPRRHHLASRRARHRRGGLSVPFGGQASWDKNQAFANDAMYPGAVDSSARWAAIEGEQRSLYYTLAGGWRSATVASASAPRLNVVQSKIHLVRARNFDGTDDLVRADGAIAEGRSLLDVAT
jgi:long-chain fatty acid transport protein